MYYAAEKKVEPENEISNFAPSSIVCKEVANEQVNESGNMEHNAVSGLEGANTGKTGNGKKRYTRVMTPARKAQNRAAQKAYRESLPKSQCVSHR